MRRSVHGAHGALLIGSMSTTSTMICARAVERGLDETRVSLGYDRVRFLKGVQIEHILKCVKNARGRSSNRDRPALLGRAEQRLDQDLHL